MSRNETRVTGDAGIGIAPSSAMVERAILTALVVLSVLTVMTRVGAGLTQQSQQAGTHNTVPVVIPVEQPEATVGAPS